MNCAQIKDRLVDYLYDGLPPEARGAFAAHLQGCTACKTEVASYAQTLDSARTALRGPLSEEPPARLHLAVIEAAKAAAKRATAAQAEFSKPSGEPGFFARLWRTPWFLPAFGAASIATVVFLVRVIKNPEVLPGQRPHSIEERSLATPEPAAQPEPAAAAPPVAAVAPAAQAKTVVAPAAAPPAASAGGGPRRLAKEASVHTESRPTVISAKKRLMDDPMSGLGFDKGQAGAGAPSRFAEPPPPRQEHGRGSKSIDDMLGAIEKEQKISPARARAADLDQPAGPRFRDDESLAERKSATAAAPAKKSPAPAPRVETEEEMEEDSLSRPSGFAVHPSPAAAPAYAPASAKPMRVDSTRSAASAPAPGYAQPAPKHEAMKQSEGAPEEDVVMDEAEASYAMKDTDKKSKGDAAPSLEEALRKAERLYASSDWNAAAAAYRELLRRFSSHKDAPKWRDRMNESLVAEQQRQAKIKKAKASSEALDGLKY